MTIMEKRLASALRQLLDASTDHARATARSVLNDYDAAHQPKPSKPRHNFHSPEPAHFIVEGLEFYCRAGVLAEAKKRGYDGTITTFYQRLSAGPLTWEHLAKPIDPQRSARASSAQRVRRDDMAKAIKGMDHG